MTQFSGLRNNVEDSNIKWRGNERTGYCRMKNEANYRNVESNIPMERQVSKIYQTCGQQSFKEENSVCDKNKWDHPVKIYIVEEWVEYGNLVECQVETDKEEKEKMVREMRGNSVKNGMEKAYVIKSFRKSGQQSSQWYDGKTGKRNTKFWRILFQSSLWEPE